MNILYKNDKMVGKSACYHMRDCHMNHHQSLWTKFSNSKAEGKPDIAALREMFVSLGFRASCDYPSSLYWKEQLEAFPNAKVVLAMRDPEKWYQSVMDTVAYMMGPGGITNTNVLTHTNIQTHTCNLSTSIPLFSPPLVHTLQGMEHSPLGIRVMQTNATREFFLAILLRDSFHGDFSRENMIRCYNDHVEDVKRTCPPGKLFIFYVEQGWGPLCAFLGKPVPDVPYPNINDTKSFQTMIRSANTKGYIVGMLGLGIPFLLAKGTVITDPKKKSTNMGSFKHTVMDPLIDYKLLSKFYTGCALMSGVLVVLHHTFLKGKH